MGKNKVSKTILIIEEIFYIFMAVYGALILTTFTLGAFKENVIFGVIVGLLCGLFGGIFVYFVFFRLHLICSKGDVYEEDLIFWRRFLPGYSDEKRNVSTENKKDVKLNLSEADVEKRILMHDSLFNKTNFDVFMSFVYKLYEDSLNKQDSLLIRPFIDDDFYFKHNLIINELSNREYREKRSYVKLKEVILRDFNIVGEQQVLVINVTSKMKKYSVDDEGEVVSGSKDDFIDCSYIFTLNRKVGLESSNEINIELCPNCRESNKVNDDGVCEHCHVDIATGEYGWVITDVKEDLL